MPQDVFTYQNAKTVKGEDLGYLTAIRYLAPADESGVNVCPAAGACKAVCLYTAGRGAFASVKDARLAKTRWRLRDREGHLDAAAKEIGAAVVRAERMGKALAVRLNGTSDLPGDALDLAPLWPSVQFYDYTKLQGSVEKYINGKYPTNYHLTLSYDPETVPWEVCKSALDRGVNVAVCFNVKRGADLPATWNGYSVLDGDLHDLRFLDPSPGGGGRGSIVGLRAKGAAKKPGLSTFTVEV